ncbi:MAG: hypothetical protein KFF73_12790 [Cyclobacteriaceae bacterium]|nr:hypothetical protein [Cyclobacteriaceae bacterium]
MIKGSWKPNACLPTRQAGSWKRYAKIRTRSSDTLLIRTRGGRIFGLRLCVLLQASGFGLYTPNLVRPLAHVCALEAGQRRRYRRRNPGKAEKLEAGSSIRVSLRQAGTFPVFRVSTIASEPISGSRILCGDADIPLR